MKRAIAGCMVACLLMAGGLVAQQRRPQDIDLQAAIRTETVDGDLQGAITKYNAIVSRYGKTDRTVAASALVHVAECYQKLGSTQARTVYAQIVREYADQPEAVAMARAQIASLEPKAPALLTMRFICADCGGDPDASLTPDGRQMAIVDSDSGDVALRNLVSGQMSRLFVKKGTWNDPPGQGEAEYPILSPDQKLMAFVWCEGPPTYASGACLPWVMPNAPGATRRRLVDSPDIEYAN